MKIALSVVVVASFMSYRMGFRACIYPGSLNGSAR